MKQLELKNLIGYLAHCLKIEHLRSTNMPIECTLIALGIEMYTAVDNEGKYRTGHIKNCKPLLKSILKTDLKELEALTGYGGFNDVESFYFNVKAGLIDKQGFDQLMMHHYDVNGLIDQGLANSIKQ